MARPEVEHRGLKKFLPQGNSTTGVCDSHGADPPECLRRLTRKNEPMEIYALSIDQRSESYTLVVEYHNDFAIFPCGRNQWHTV